MGARETPGGFSLRLIAYLLALLALSTLAPLSPASDEGAIHVLQPSPYQMVGWGEGILVEAIPGSLGGELEATVDGRSLGTVIVEPAAAADTWSFWMNASAELGAGWHELQVRFQEHGYAPSGYSAVVPFEVVDAPLPRAEVDAAYVDGDLVVVTGRVDQMDGLPLNVYLSSDVAGASLYGVEGRFRIEATAWQIPTSDVPGYLTVEDPAMGINRTVPIVLDVRESLVLVDEQMWQGGRLYGVDVPAGHEIVAYSCFVGQPCEWFGGTDATILLARDADACVGTPIVAMGPCVMPAVDEDTYLVIEYQAWFPNRLVVIARG